MEAQKERKLRLKLAVSVGSPRPLPDPLSLVAPPLPQSLTHRQPHMTYHAGPMAATALVAPTTMAFVALLKVKLPLNHFPGTSSSWFHSPIPDPMMSPSQTEVQPSRARVGRWPFHETRIPKGLECQAQEIVSPLPQSPSPVCPRCQEGNEHWLSESHILTHAPRRNHKNRYPSPI